VRGHAAVALGKLMTMNSRVDPLVTELLAGFNSPDSGVQEAMVRALTNVISQVGKDISEKVLNNVAGAISNFIKSEDSGKLLLSKSKRLIYCLRTRYYRRCEEGCG